MFRWMTGIKSAEKISTEEIRAGAGLVNISEDNQRTRQDYVERKEDALMRTRKMAVSGHQKLGRTKLKQKDMNETGVRRIEAQYWRNWRTKT